MHLIQYEGTEDIMIASNSKKELFISDNYKRSYDFMTPGQTYTIEWIFNPQVVSFKRYPTTVLTALTKIGGMFALVRIIFYFIYILNVFAFERKVKYMMH